MESAAVPAPVPGEFAQPLPSAEQVRAFLADTRETKVKRDELVDKLIGSGDYVELWTNKWTEIRGS